MSVVSLPQIFWTNQINLESQLDSGGLWPGQQRTPRRRVKPDTAPEEQLRRTGSPAAVARLPCPPRGDSTCLRMQAKLF